MSIKINSLREDEIRDIGDAFADLLKTVPGCLNTGHLIKMAKGCGKAGKSYGAILSKLKIPYIYVGMVAVRKEYQDNRDCRYLRVFECK